MLEWTVEVRDASRVRVGQLAEHDLTDFIAVPRPNAVGDWTLSLPATVLNETTGRRVSHELCAALRQRDAGIIVYNPDGQVVLSGPMSQAVLTQLPGDPDGMWQFTGDSDTDVVRRPVAYPQPSNPNVSTQNVANDIRSGKAETLIRQYVSANIGPAAHASRRVAGLTLAPDGGLGPVLQKSPRFQNLLELLQEIATGTVCLFDVIQDGTDLQFRVLPRIDVSADLRWDIDNSQLESTEYGFGRPGVTRVIVAGQDQGTSRKIIEVTTPASLAAEAIWGRVERFLDQRNTNDDGELRQAGLEVLATEGAEITSLKIVPSADMGAGFMSEWWPGSIVTVVVGGQEVKAPVSEVVISIGAHGVFIGATVGDATGFDWESVMSNAQTRTEQRVSALERADAQRPNKISFPTTVSLLAFTGWPGLVGYSETDGVEYVWTAASGWRLQIDSLLSAVTGAARNLCLNPAGISGTGWGLGQGLTATYSSSASPVWTHPVGVSQNAYLVIPFSAFGAGLTYRFRIRLLDVSGTPAPNVSVFSAGGLPFGLIGEMTREPGGWIWEGSVTPSAAAANPQIWLAVQSAGTGEKWTLGEYVLCEQRSLPLGASFDGSSFGKLVTAWEGTPYASVSNAYRKIHP